MGDKAGARAAYEVCLAIAERLTATDPTNRDWQGDLVRVHEHLRRNDRIQIRWRRWPRRMPMSG